MGRFVGLEEGRKGSGACREFGGKKQVEGPKER